MKLGGRCGPKQIAKWISEVEKGSMSKDELAEQAKRKPDTVKKWLQAGKRARIMESAAALGTKVPARTSQGFQRKIGFGSGIKVYLPLLCTTSRFQFVSRLLNRSPEKCTRRVWYTRM